MKLRYFTLLSCLLLASTLVVMGADTNELYLTVDSYTHFIYTENSEKIHHDMLLAEAKKTRESLPATYFPEGNWGNMEGGFQLSLRFTKQIYTNNEPIAAILLLRNVTNQVNDRYVYFPWAGNCDGPAVFYVSSGSGEIISGRSTDPRGMDAHGRSAPDLGCQHKYFEHLNEGYDLTNGTYNVQAMMTIPYPGSNKWEKLNLKSGTASVKIQSAASNKIK